MKHIWKVCVFALCVCLLMVSLSACNKKEEVQVELPSEASVYASFYPIYALAEALVIDVPDLRLNCLIQPQDGCLRSYELSDWDLALAASADLILAGGGGLESFESVLYALMESGVAVSAVLHDLDLTQMRATNTQDDSDSHWLSPNPHIYMGVDGGMEMLRNIAAALSAWDAQHAQQYQVNLENAINRLKSVDAEIQTVRTIAQDVPVIIMNEALIYVAQDYDMEIALCYDRESGEMLSEDDLAACLQMLENSGSRIIMIEKQAPEALCAALEEAGFHLVRMDIMSTKRATEGFEGYLDVLRYNAAEIEKALNEAN